MELFQNWKIACLDRATSATLRAFVVERLPVVQYAAMVPPGASARIAAASSDCSARIAMGAMDRFTAVPGMTELQVRLRREVALQRRPHVWV